MQKATKLTRVQKLIFLTVIANDGLPITGLYQLSIALEIDYRWSRQCVLALERMGLLAVTKPYGREMVITAKRINGYWSFLGSLWGPVVSNDIHMMHKAEGENPNMDPTSSLRASYSEDGKYPRPELSSEEAKRYAKAAAKLNSLTDQRIRLSYIIGLVIENARLLREVNEHRAARGYDPLPIYEPKDK